MSRAAIDLPAGEDADIAARHRCSIAAIGQDGAVEEGEIGLAWMLDRHRFRNGMRNLLAGIYGDTLGLRTPSTTPTSLRTAAELIEAGADMDAIVDALFRLKPYSTICLWAEALQRAQWRGVARSSRR